MSSDKKLLDEPKIDLYIAVLEREKLLMEQLLEIQRDKKPLIVLAKPEELDKVNMREGVLVSDLEKTEGARFKLQKDLAAVLGIESEALTAQLLYLVLSEQYPEKAGRLQETSAGIQRSVTSIKELNEENHQLLETALEYISEMQWMLTGDEGAGTYSGSGDMDSKPPPPRIKIIDAKA